MLAHRIMMISAACFAWGMTVLASETSSRPAPTIVVTAFGARGDGKTDDTAAFQKALDAARESGGVVEVPTGSYVIAGSLTIHAGVTLQGVWQAPHHSDIGKGSILMAVGHEGQEDGPPLINLMQSSCIKGVTLFYPNQKIEAVKAYPWAIQGRGMHGSVVDVTLVNPYKGIDFGTHGNELHYVRNVFGCPLKIGVYINGTTDIGRVENVHFNPHYWMRAAHAGAPREGTPAMNALFNYLKENLVGFIVGRTDWEYMTNCFVIFPKIGYHFIQTPQGKPNAVLTQCGSDIGPCAVRVDASQDHAGVAFSNSQFMSTIITGAKNRGPVKFSNCGFWPTKDTRQQAIIEGGGLVTFSTCHFSGWGTTVPCLQVLSGSVIVSGCDFNPPGSGRQAIELGPATRSAAIVGNRLSHRARIVNHAPSSASVQIGLNIE